MTTPNPETHKHLVDALCSGYVFDTYGAEALLKEYVAPLQELAEIGRLVVAEKRLIWTEGTSLDACSAARHKVVDAVDAFITKYPTP